MKAHNYILNTSPALLCRCTVSTLQFRILLAEWRSCVGRAAPALVSYICLRHGVQILTEVRERGKKRTVSQIYFFTLLSRSLSTEQTEVQFFFPLGFPPVFFLNLMRARAVFCAVMVLLSRGNSLWIRHSAAYSLRLTHRRSECVCVWENVCVFLSEPETLTCIVGFVEQNYF